MTKDQKILAIVEKQSADKLKVDAIKSEYKKKAKSKALTTSERLDRIEKILGIV